jgi:hypothetical protein
MEAAFDDPSLVCARSPNEAHARLVDFDFSRAVPRSSAWSRSSRLDVYGALLISATVISAAAEGAPFQLGRRRPACRAQVQ